MKQPNGKFIEGRFWTNIEKTRSGCWIWQGAKNNSGYGVVYFRGKNIVAHRLAWKLWGEKISIKFELDHLCRKRSCINPMHLEPVTHRENILRGKSPSAHNAKKKRCKRGHKYARIQIRKDGKKQRVCTICMKDYLKKYRENNVH